MKQTLQRDSQVSSIPDILRAFAKGEMIVVTDDERRENEGDLIIAAEFATPDAINFMITHGRGLVCVAMESSRLASLDLARMPQQGGGRLRTAFMESVDACSGVTTGISAFDRARTIAALLKPSTKPSDLVRPGHIFPLEAAAGGVLRRPGHTEAAVDLARLAGLTPAGVICEILDSNGQMLRGSALMKFARRHRLRTTTVAALATHRKKTESMAVCEQTIRFPTDVGLFRLRLYRSHLDDGHHLALVYGKPTARKSALVRIHSECLTGDVFGSLRCDCGSQLKEAMQRVAKEGAGVVLYLRQEGRGIGLDQKIRAYALQEKGLDTVEANLKLGFDPDLRDYTIAAHILRDIGLQSVRLLTNNPAKLNGLAEAGIDVVERVPLILPTSPHNQRYLNAKKRKLGHWL